MTDAPHTPAEAEAYFELALSLGEEFEGFRAKPYKCPAGKLTIGIGRNIEQVGVSYQEAKVLQRGDLWRAHKQLNDEPYWGRLGSVQRAALLDMMFNLGWTRFKRFRLMRDALAKGDYAKAAAEAQDSKWYNQVGRRGRIVVHMIWTDKVPTPEDIGEGPPP